jgi:hypothetical protein
MSITSILSFRDQQHFSSSVLKQDGSSGDDWRKQIIERYNEAANFIIQLEERLEQQEKYIVRLERMNDSLLGNKDTSTQELA